MNEKIKTLSIVVGSLLVVVVLYICGNINASTSTSTKNEVIQENNKVITDKVDVEEATSNKESTEIKGESENKTTSYDDKKDDSKEVRNDKLIFKSNLGFSMTFPDSWKDKYTIVEESNSISVYFKSSDLNIDPKSGLFFLVIKQDESLDPSLFDTIDIENYINVNDEVYFIGGPTDISLSENASDFNTFISMNKDRKEIIESIVSSK
ncbi:hypothetical protein FDB55_14635 [Clostridium botulinum]|uniref:Uncharacterized protein n=1 Tax=Clostridium botulinum TaxID=1491 RepID=A0A0M1LS81_CLOBO|nr:hypothetical protein [Clostridium botulinum]KOM86834.1 hypothetical protein ACP51_14485 [Clostridium botulinum]KOR60481.1 hypothetical protein ADT22_08435 [Clostridium botulinum]MBN1035750.1 hypothetical protein [Clostridium botulinum]MBN1058892.1 hypothetical protein [Clostridium botulinum]MBN1062061.1 hypothetical protein [Clostridium botulinum]